MSEEEIRPTKINIISNIRLRHVGTLDLGEFYRWLNRWFTFEGYSVYEKQYIEKIESGGSKTYYILWDCKKKKTKYFEYRFELRWLLVGVGRIEIQKGTDKVRVESGDFEIRMDTDLLMGPQTDDFLAKHEWFRKAYENFLIRGRIEEMRVDIYNKTNDLQEDIKKYFNQATHL